MKRLLRILLIVFVVGAIVIQFFRPEKNLGTSTPDHIFEKEQIPENVKTILKNACMDCHSDQTNYLWYHNIVPVAWMINDHIVEGKDELNFSEWGQLDTFDKIGALEEICREVERKKMPIKAYVQMHKEARLTEEQVAALCAWTEKLSEELIGAE
ncbi:cytochrome C [Maribellus comscasis]|uniref:Cytochrome C n=1 Tax=Maribellus comscasis TaxID=2681766 RepID=A0A6I6JNF9_9BACT|nr:heme-binding domain-containing protein [Maribellus comscasis]QGY42510.1 cytochrome C [Maribellus comscasis]